MQHARKLALLFTICLTATVSAAEQALPEDEIPVKVSAVPTIVRDRFKSEFVIHGNILTPRPGKAPCIANEEQFRGLEGWFKTRNPLTDADKVNGIHLSERYVFRIRYQRINAEADWQTAIPSVDEGTPFDVVYEIRSKPQVRDSKAYCL